MATNSGVLVIRESRIRIQRTSPALAALSGTQKRERITFLQR
jgi:hypothetical protein